METRGDTEGEGDLCIHHPQGPAVLCRDKNKSLGFLKNPAVSSQVPTVTVTTGDGSDSGGGSDTLELRA